MTVTDVEAQAPDIRTYEAEAALLKVLADPARLLILRTLARSPKPLSVTELTEIAAPLSQPTVSHHIGLLRRAGLVVRQDREAGVRYTYHAFVPAQLKAAQAALVEIGRRK